MPHIDELFNLIKSLEPSEKRYFKLHAGKHLMTGNYKNNSEKLFDALNNWADTEYDEKLFRKKNKGKVFLKNLPFEKNYLHSKIMAVLRSYHAETTPEGKLNNILADIRLLYNKGQHQAAMKVLSEGFELAESTESLSAILLLYQFKHKLTRHAHSEQDIKQNNEDFEKEKLILQKLGIEREIINKYKNIYYLSESGLLKKSLTDSQNAINKYDRDTYSASLSFYSKYYLLNAKILIAQTDGKYEEAMKLFEAIFDLWEQKDAHLNESSADKRINYGNYLVSAHYAEKFDVFPGIIEKMEKLPIESLKEEAEAFHIIQSYKLVYYLNSKGTSNFNKVVNEIEAGLLKHGGLISKKIRIGFYVNICILYLQHHQFQNLLDYTDKTLTIIGRDNTRKYETRALKFFEMMARYSLKNYDLLDYLIRNNERWLREHEMNNDFTTAVLATFRQLMQNKRDKEKDGQLLKINCPPDTEMLKELIVSWLDQNKPAPAIA